MSAPGAGQHATGRPTQPWPWPVRLLVLALVVPVALEVPLWLPHESKLLAPWWAFAGPAYARYLPVRAWAVSHPVLATLLVALFAVLVVLVVRWGLLFWHNDVRARFTGTYFVAEEAVQFPLRAFDLLKAIAARPPGHTFLGFAAKRGWLGFGWRWSPLYLSEKQRSMHTHVLGKTGSGKTASVLWPQVLQDALDGKGVVVIDAKGSDENVGTMRAIAALAGRESQLRVFCLPAWNSPSVWSHTYNMVWVRPRRPGDAGGDVAAMAERVFSVLSLGDNEYYNTQAQLAFTSICRLLHGMVDDDGVGLVFTMRDVAICLKGIGGVGAYEKALNFVLKQSVDVEAAAELVNQVGRLGRDVQKCLSGVVGAVDKFLSPLVNAYAPDIVFEDVLQTNGLVYVQLPGNLFKLQAPALGKVVLQDIQQEGSLRQVFRQTRNQTTCSVVVDEFYNFADVSVIDSLNKLRDANLHYTLAHQSVADLELVSKEFAMGVWDNTRTKVILSQDNPELCEKVSKSIGTHQVIETTVRRQEGALLTSLTTGDASSKLVETFRLHPNAIKNLRPFGQGYCYFGNSPLPVSFGMLPEVRADFVLPRNNQATAKGVRLEQFLSAGAAAANVSVSQSDDEDVS